MHNKVIARECRTFQQQSWNPTPTSPQNFNPVHQASNKQKLSLRVTCARALCSLLQPLCHFNFAPNLCKAVVSKLTSPHADIATSCRECIASFFATNRSRDIILGMRSRALLLHALNFALRAHVTLHQSLSRTPHIFLSQRRQPPYSKLPRA